MLPDNNISNRLKNVEPLKVTQSSTDNSSVNPLIGSKYEDDAIKSGIGTLKEYHLREDRQEYFGNPLTFKESLTGVIRRAKDSSITPTLLQNLDESSFFEFESIKRALSMTKEEYDTDPAIPDRFKETAKFDPDLNLSRDLILKRIDRWKERREAEEIERLASGLQKAARFVATMAAGIGTDLVPNVATGLYGVTTKSLTKAFLYAGTENLMFDEVVDFFNSDRLIAEGEMPKTTAQRNEERAAAFLLGGTLGASFRLIGNVIEKSRTRNQEPGITLNEMQSNISEFKTPLEEVPINLRDNLANLQENIRSEERVRKRALSLEEKQILIEKRGEDKRKTLQFKAEEDRKTISAKSDAIIKQIELRATNSIKQIETQYASRIELKNAETQKILADVNKTFARRDVIDSQIEKTNAQATLTEIRTILENVKLERDKIELEIKRLGGNIESNNISTLQRDTENLNTQIESLNTEKENKKNPRQRKKVIKDISEKIEIIKAKSARIKEETQAIIAEVERVNTETSKVRAERDKVQAQTELTIQNINKQIDLEKQQLIKHITPENLLFRTAKLSDMQASDKVQDLNTAMSLGKATTDLNVTWAKQLESIQTRLKSNEALDIDKKEILPTAFKIPAVEGIVNVDYKVFDIENIILLNERSEGYSSFRGKGTLEEPSNTVIKRAKNIDTDRLLFGKEFDNGAPLIDNNGAMVLGNNRTIALYHAYKNNLGSDYLETLRKSFPQHNIEGMKYPILVKQLIEPINPNKFNEIRSKKGTFVRGERAAEILRQNAELITNPSIDNLDRLTKLNHTERLDALTYVAFKNENIVNDTTELGAVLRDIAQNTIETTRNRPEFDISTNLSQAFDIINLTTTNPSLLLKILDEEDISPLTEKLVRSFFANDTLTTPASRIQIKEALQDYYRQVQQGLKRTPEEILNVEAKQRPNILPNDSSSDNIDINNLSPEYREQYRALQERENNWREALLDFYKCKNT